MDKNNLVSIYDSHPNELAEEFKDVKRDTDPEFLAPLFQKAKTHVVGREQIRLSQNV